MLINYYIYMPEGHQEGQSRQVQEIRNIMEEPFPEDPNERFEAIFAAIGNSEAKCVTLLTMQTYPLSAFELHKEFLRDTNYVWRTGTPLQEGYAQKSFIPIGLVAQADTLFYGSMEFVNGYRTTQAGEKFGKPIAAFLLKSSRDLSYSLNQLFGLTAAGPQGNRSVLNRVKILEYLLDQKTMQSKDFSRAADITNVLGIDEGSTSDHLLKMKNLGLVEYSSLDPEEKQEGRYTLVEGGAGKPVEVVGGQPTLTRMIDEIVFDLKTVDVHIVAEEMRKRNPNKKFHLPNLSAVLADFARQGILSSEYIYGKGGYKSKATITPDGECIVNQIISPIKKALTPEGQALLEEWRRIPWQSYAADGVGKHKENSGNAKQRSVEEWTSNALQIIINNPGIRPNELTKLLKRAPADCLKILIEKGQIRKEKQGTAIRYYST